MTEQRITAECPDGYYAVESDRCVECAFFSEKHIPAIYDRCWGCSCAADERKDGLSVSFKKIEYQ